MNTTDAKDGLKIEANRIKNGSTKLESGEEQAVEQKSDSKQELKDKIEASCNSYKQELGYLIEKDDFKTGFKNDNEYNDCKQCCNGIINDLSTDKLIDSYCKSDDQSRKAVKEEFVKRSRKKQIRENKSYQWPTYSEDYKYTSKKSGKMSKVRGKGANFDIHHVIPKSLGGSNDSSNTIPMHAAYHFDKQGIHASGQSLATLENLLKDYKDNGFCCENGSCNL